MTDRRLNRERARLKRERDRRGQIVFRSVWCADRWALTELLVMAEFLHVDHVDDKAAIARALELYLASQCRV